MANIETIFYLTKTTSFGISILLSLIYSLPILLIPRFHHQLNIFTVNICFSIICGSSYWMGYFIMYQYYIEYLFTPFTCTFLFYIQTLCTLFVPLSFLVLTINRFFVIVYPTKALFKTKKYVFICIASQWIASSILAIPFQTEIQPYCVLPRWLPFYQVIIFVIAPTLVILIVNVGIFKHVHNSSRRIQPKNELTIGNVTVGGQLPRISRRDIHLLKHTIFMFSVFIIGWGPIFSLVALDYEAKVSELVYAILQILSVTCIMICVFNLFLYNRELRQYLKDKLCGCF